MINLKENIVELVNLNHTVRALKDLNYLIAEYKRDCLGPAYLVTRHLGFGDKEFQINREFIVPALEAQRESIVAYLAKVGIDAGDYNETE